MIALVIAAQVGDALAPSLVDRHPLLLIILNARNRNLALTTVNLDAVSYYVVGTIRLMISDPLFYLLGWFYGETAIRWMERRTPTYGRLMRRFESAFRKAAYPLIFIAPNNPICLLAGASGMRPITFFALNLSGTLARLYAIRWIGDVFSDPIESILGFIQDYRIPLLVLTVSLVGWTFMREWRRGSTEVASLAHLDEGLEEAREDLEADREEMEPPAEDD